MEILFLPLPYQAEEEVEEEDEEEAAAAEKKEEEEEEEEEVEPRNERTVLQVEIPRSEAVNRLIVQKGVKTDRELGEEMLQNGTKHRQKQMFSSRLMKLP
ncbi:hypothetical protein M0802_009483 [Mischocyttarus mexicanus]|nr:hypothetical protein M0802_009483 [Mischocyttarus mexicanus]